MKLYTREQMIEAFNYGQNPKGFDWIGDMIDSLIPIELPSDEGIEIGMNQRLFLSDKHLQFNSGAKAGFKLGAEWMKEQILKQKKNNYGTTNRN